MLSRKELAEKRGVTERTIDRYREKGMPYHQAFKGADVKFDEKEVDEWMKKGGK